MKKFEMNYLIKETGEIAATGTIRVDADDADEAKVLARKQLSVWCGDIDRKVFLGPIINV